MWCPTPSGPSISNTCRPGRMCYDGTHDQDGNELSRWLLVRCDPFCGDGRALVGSALPLPELPQKHRGAARQFCWLSTRPSDIRRRGARSIRLLARCYSLFLRSLWHTNRLRDRAFTRRDPPIHLHHGRAGTFPTDCSFPCQRAACLAASKRRIATLSHILERRPAPSIKAAPGARMADLRAETLAVPVPGP